MAIENIPVWTIEPNWSESVVEALEWLTSILSSPTGAEQRRCLRLYPRKTIEYDIVVAEEERSAAEQQVARFGAINFYLPIWFESYTLSVDAPSGATSLNVPSASNGGIKAGDILFLGSLSDVTDFELVEVAGVTGSTVTLVSAIETDWPAFIKVHPVRKARFAEQPTFQMRTDRMASASLTFMVMQPNEDALALDTDIDAFDAYEGSLIFTLEPETSQRLERGAERLIETFDNQVSIPVYRDTAGIPFFTQQFRWVCQGRGEYADLIALLYALAGRFTNCWLPSYNDDLMLTADISGLLPLMQVKNFGFTDSGGISEGRTHICIFKNDGTRIYRRITASAVLSGGDEFIAFDSLISGGLTKESVLRISFMQLSRLDQDRIEISHETDTEGLSVCVANFRAAPNLRQVAAGF